MPQGAAFKLDPTQMAHDWHEYQKEAAAFFRSLGMEASIDHPLEGVRGKHKIDVFVEGAFHRILFRWIIECKAWRTNIPKEKVMALTAIVQDVGADRGFLLSEVGFQSGAIRATRNSNITLSSLNDLRLTVGESLEEATIAALSWRTTRAQQRIRGLKKVLDESDYYLKCLRTLSKLSALHSTFDDAVNGIYPNVVFWAGENGMNYSTENFDDFVLKVEMILAEAEQLAASLEPQV